MILQNDVARLGVQTSPEQVSFKFFPSTYQTLTPPSLHNQLQL